MTIKYNQWYKWRGDSEDNPSLQFIYYFCPRPPHKKKIEPHSKIWEENSYEGTLIRFVIENNRFIPEINTFVSVNIQSNTRVGIPRDSNNHLQSISKEEVAQDFLSMQSSIYYDLLQL